MDILKLFDALTRKAEFYSHAPLYVREYLPAAWETLNSFFRLHQENALVRETHREYQVFIPRAFTLTAVLHSAFGYPPSRRDLLVTAIDFLVADLTEKELELFTYVDDVIKSGRGTYAPGVVAFYLRLVKLYRELDFSHEHTPPSPWHAFCILGLSRPEFTRGDSPVSDSVFSDAVIACHAKFDQNFRLIEKK